MTPHHPPRLDSEESDPELEFDVPAFCEDQMESLQFADTAHTLRNIIARMTEPVRLIDKASAEGDLDSLRSIWPICRRAIFDADMLCRNILCSLKPGSPDIRMVNIPNLLESVVDQYTHYGQVRRVRLILDTEVSPSFWPLDEERTRTAVGNLVINAIQAIAADEGSTVRIEGQTRHNGTELLIAVSDDGPGVPQSIRKRIFEPFMTTKAGGGVGLGLVCVQQTMRLHGGRVFLRSVPYRETRFSLAFPQTPPVAARVA